MKKEDKKKIDEIVAGMKCPKDFKCASAGFDKLCKAKTFGLENFLECLDENRATCTFAHSFGNVSVCFCPLRMYIAKKLKM